MREGKKKLSCLLDGRKGTGTKMDVAGIPDLTILHCNDAKEWKVYLMDCFSQLALPHRITIHEERLEDLTFPVPLGHSQAFTSAKAVLIVISPDFLDFVDSHGEVYELGKLLQPTRTIAMLCGVQEEDILPIHRAALVSYDAWPRLVARDQDKEFVLSVLHTTQEVLGRETISSPQFKLANRKVKQGNGTVYIMLNKPMSDKQKAKVILESDGLHDVPVKRRNPYTLQFIVPDSCMTSSKFINVHLKCDDGYLGCRPLKYESKMGELNTLLNSLNSPYEMLCQTLGVSSLGEVDSHLAKAFSHTFPDLSMKVVDNSSDSTKSEEELPTLLHFSARYGLRQLTVLVIQSPVAKIAVLQKNSQGLVPAQLATLAGHHEIATILQDFQMRLSISKPSSDGVSSTSIRGTRESTECVYEHMKDIHLSLYDTPPCPGNRRRSEGEGSYLTMLAQRKLSSLEGLEPHQRLLFDVTSDDHRKTTLELPRESLLSQDVDSVLLRNGKEDQDDDRQGVGRGSQQELIEILENYKRGASLTEVERLFHDWQSRHQYSSEARREGLEDLRERYREAVKEKKVGGRLPQLSDLRSFISSKLGRKDSISNKMPASAESDRLTVPSGEVYRPVSTLSTASTASNSSSASSDRCSAMSAASVYDSGNHSDSCDELAKLKGMQEQRTASQRSTASGDRSKLIRSSPCLANPSAPEKPPVPPPRPPKLPLSRPPQPVDEEESEHLYYAFPLPDEGQENKNDSEVISPDYVSPDCGSPFFRSGMDVAANRVFSVYQTVPSAVSCKNPGDHLASPDHVAQSYDDLYQIPPTPVPAFVPPSALKSTANAGRTVVNKYYSNVMLRQDSVNDETSDSRIYYDIPALPVPLNAGPSQMARRHSLDQSLHSPKTELYGLKSREPTYVEIVAPPDGSSDDRHQYYDIPRYAYHDDQCDSVPDELPPPPPVEETTAPTVVVDGTPSSESTRRRASTLPPLPLETKLPSKVKSPPTRFFV